MFGVQTKQVRNLLGLLVVFVLFLGRERPNEVRVAQQERIDQRGVYPQQKLRVASIVSCSLCMRACLKWQSAMNAFMQGVNSSSSLPGLFCGAEHQPFAMHEGALGSPERIGHIAAVIAHAYCYKWMGQLHQDRARTAQ